MNEKKRLFLDMDGTLARFHDEVQYLERMYEEGFFRNLVPFENMVNGIKQFISEHPDVEVYILSSKVIGEPPYCEAEKHAWLDQYLPEIDRDHRIFPDIGVPKTDYIHGLSKNDFLLDDYNHGLEQFLSAGSNAIKCHNNINQRGTGAYGGEAGSLWIGPMVHITDKPEMISAELAKHMGLSYNLEHVAAAYSIEYVSDPQSETHSYPVLRAAEGAFPMYRAERSGGISIPFTDPLNALRCLNGQEEFEELFLGTSLEDARPLAVTQAQLADINFNLGYPPNYISLDDSLWLESVATTLKPQQQHISATPEVSPVFLFEEDRSGDRMGSPSDPNNIAYANWFEYYALDDNHKPQSIGHILGFTPKGAPWPSHTAAAEKSKLYNEFSQKHPDNQIIVLPLAPGQTAELSTRMNAAIRKFEHDNQSLKILPAHSERDRSLCSRFASVDDLASAAAARADARNASHDTPPIRPSQEKEPDMK